MRLNNIILKPIVTEKTYSQISGEVYTFMVPRNATKESVAQEITRIYGVKVIDVRSNTMPGKNRRVSGTRRFSGRDKWKKISVKLKAGQTIDVMPKE